MIIIIIGTVASSFLGFRADLIKILIQKNHIVYAFTSEYTNSELEKIKLLGAIPVTYEQKRGGLNPLVDVISTYLLTNKIKAIAPDLVFSYFSKPVIFGTLAARWAKVPKVIGMLEGLGYTFTKQPKGLIKRTQLIKQIQIALYRISLPRLDTLIFLNPDDPNDLLEEYSIKVRKVEVLGGIGLNLDDYSYSNNYPKNPVFIFIARLLAEKGIHDYIAAAKIVKNIYPQARFVVLGAIDKVALGALTEVELRQVIKASIIEYPGHVNNVSDWITKSSVFVLPSYYREGVPRSTQEAMAIGRPIITTDVPGCRETVIDGVNGFLVEKWNPKALAEKMIYFIEHPEQIKEMGDESYKLAQEKFDADKVNKRLINMLGL
ncbi:MULTISPECIES: glycosyltransferase family 4 protein [unclassified Psychrobacter]|uniref:glycosyltransferase family 4 protein n=1 Tax=unclassified Psychrobacter TaxID=196806 RepID=UPI00086E2DE4|nr:MULTISPECIES: glycosyltransferase family 4 protein [unclassified Psychrobacter]MBA6245119.1 glycosyltransferase family 4 protein [Psychrobacter sp. Urea-trap-18]MBA6286722.1 glycosyltransferase family 4 protein [Psychrobacter sp. Urea-trap-16]MBA6317819.1 glycosyltransferase family 4 protein [Psychrobacter sp. Urea-trap-20]MBA6334446.1 glycosyltransferase family 4 protein [Psychrobacter sp. Urea-trap-19]OEH68461.1 MAG: glycosyl transferase family 1 [Psychrobacter sp. B29-1]|tara:strand:+ start:5928 stop:7055 length:1128 start_codon:yes stop_codon:yes gene_type:complete